MNQRRVAQASRLPRRTRRIRIADSWRAVTLMNMHKSKGKEFDAVVIVEGRHRDRLLDPGWDAKRTIRNRRVLRVAITRARHAVILVRPPDAIPLVPPVGPPTISRTAS